MLYRYLIFCTFCLFTGNLLAQDSLQTKSQAADTLNPTSYFTEDYSHFQLPPLQTLLENIKVNNPQVLENDANIEAAQYDLKIEKKKWFSYLSARAGYSYGILGTYSDFETEYKPLTTTYTGSSQHSYSVGANLTIPINDLLSRGTSVKRQKKIIEQAEYNREAIYNMIKIEVVDLYATVQSLLSIFRHQAETVAAFDANYKVTANNFVNGKATPYDISIVKNEQTKALAEFEATRAKLISMIIRLEIITGTQMIKK